MSSMHKHLTFFALYLAQATPMSAFTTLLPILMRQQALSLTAIGMVQLVRLPWLFKFLWAPFIDRHTKDLSSFKRWIIGTELFYAMIIVLIAFLRLEVDFPLILTLIVIALTCSATHDIATDALTTLSYAREERSLANSMQSMGGFAASILGGGGLLITYHYIGWQATFLGLALWVLLLLLPLLAYRPNNAVYKPTQKAIGMKDIYRFFTQPQAWRQVGFLVLTQAGIVGTMTMMKPYLVDQGYDLIEIGYLFNLYGAGCGFVASWLCNLYIKRKGLAKAAIHISAYIALSAMAITGLSLIKPLLLPHLLLWLTLLWSSFGLSTVLVYTIAMNYVREGREGTDFTLQIVLFHFSAMIIAMLAGVIADTIGYSGFFSIEAKVAIISFLYITWFAHQPDATRAFLSDRPSS